MYTSSNIVTVVVLDLTIKDAYPHARAVVRGLLPRVASVRVAYLSGSSIAKLDTSQGRINQNWVPLDGVSLAHLSTLPGRYL